ncbi:MAG TPA: hypothetical protein VF886_05640 [Roseiarcus sp.]|jgi:hypothetical protein
MSDVIRFQPAKAPPRSAPDDRGAQILFFTGVRYQRMSEDPRAPAKRASSQRQGEDGAGDRTRRR